VSYKKFAWLVNYNFFRNDLGEKSKSPIFAQTF